MCLLSLPIFSSAASKNREAVLGEYVVQVHPGTEININNILRSSAFQIFDVRSLSEDIYSFRTSLLVQSNFVIQSILSDSRVKHIEPNFIYRTAENTNDPLLPKLWGLVNFGQSISGFKGEKRADISAKKAWRVHKGSRNVIVAVIDTGVDYNHLDLKNNMWVNTAEKNGKEGVDDDENGFIDDIHGYSFFEGDSMDNNGHGTHVAGVIGAEGNNGIGIVGVNWEVSIMAVKFLNARGSGTLEGAVEAIKYALDNGAHVMNNSWGSTQKSEILKESIIKTEQAGVVFVAAAGNAGTDSDQRPYFPATYDVDNVISVGSINNRGKMASFSNYGKTTVDVASPGKFIFSSLPNDKYGSFSGTSMSSPFVAGVAALLISYDNLNYKEVIQRLIRSSRKDVRLKNKVVAHGWIDAYFALTDRVHPQDPKDPDFWPLHSNYDYSTKHPYLNKNTTRFMIQVPGAKQFSLLFSRFKTERKFDKLSFFVEGKEVASMSGNLGEDFYGPIIQGDQVELVFTSNKSRNSYGFDISSISYRVR